MGATNPLLAEHRLPAFGAIAPEHAAPAIERILADNRALIARLAGEDPAEATLLLPLEAAAARLQEAFSPIRHLRAVLGEAEWRDAYKACLEKITEYNTELAQNKELYEKFLELREGVEWARLPAARQAEVAHALRDFRLGGVHLPEREKARFAALEAELAACCARFTDNVTDATGAWSLHLEDASRLDGVPDSDCGLMREDAEAHGQSGWRVNLTPPCVQAVLTHARNRDLRRTVFEANATRASDQGPHAGTYDNTELIGRILELRYEQARLLGFGTIAEHALATRMAKRPEDVLAFLRDLLDRARPMAQKELAFLRGFAENELGLEDLQRWDLAWVSERARAAELGLKDEELKPYFAADATVAGMLELAASLFRLEIARRDGIAAWHSDVQFYELREVGGELLGQFYLDPYARAGKHGGAWMDACAQRRRRGDGVQPAVAYLTCNAAPPAGDAPALLTHSDAVTLFHEFGHGLHHMLTRVDCAGVSGIEGVEWDAVEWPSQWMENWCWEPAALRRFACHYRTGEAMPEELLDRLQASRRFNAGLALMRQLEFALFDFRLHLEYRPDRGPRVAELLAEIRRDIDLLEVPEFVRTAHSFEHIFSGGYTAGYYSYKWAEVLSGDTFEAFQEEGLFNPETARRFCDCMLAGGGVRPAAEMFEAFRGRPPHPGALLRQMGLAA